MCEEVCIKEEKNRCTHEKIYAGSKFAVTASCIENFYYVIKWYTDKITWPTQVLTYLVIVSYVNA